MLKKLFATPLLVLFAGCNFLGGETADYIRSCGTLERNTNEDKDYDAVFGCMSERVERCTKGKYVVDGQFEFAITGLNEDAETCNFRMEYLSLDDMKKVNVPTRLHENAGLYKECTLTLPEILAYKNINDAFGSDTSAGFLFNKVFWELAFSVVDRCEGTYVDKVRNNF